MKFHLIVPVWGEEYIDRWMRQVMPLHFGRGGLGEFARLGHQAALHIHTLAEDVERFARYPSFDLARTFLPVELHGHELTHTSLPLFYLLTDLYNRAIDEAAREEAAMIMWQPDAVLSRGAFERIVRLRERGYRAVMVPGIPVEAESFFARLSELGMRLPKGRDFVALVIECLHQREINDHLWQELRVSEGPSFLFWRDAGSGSLLVRTFHPHPIMVDPVRRSERLYWTPDVEYVRLACPDFRQVYQVMDSDEMTVASLSSANVIRFEAAAPLPSSVEAVARWMHFGADAYHRRYFTSCYWVHSVPLDDGCESLKLASDRIAEGIMMRADELDNLFETLVAAARGREIAIFGAGALGQLLSRTLIMYDRPPAVLLDSDPAKWGWRLGILLVEQPVPERIIGRFIVVASMWGDEIREYLHELGLRERDDYLTVAPDAVWHGVAAM